MQQPEIGALVEVVDFNDGEREVARLVNEHCNEIVRRAVAAGKVEAGAYAARGRDRLLDLLRRRGVKIGPHDAVEPIADPRTGAAVAIRVTSRRADNLQAQ